MVNFIEDKDFVQKHKTSEKCFTRDRVWTFKTTFLFICSMLGKRVQTEIDSFFSKLYDVPEEIRHVTASAFTQCREKVSYSAFREACWYLVETFYSQYSFKRYYGFRLVAIDGSVYTVPKTEAMIEEFGENVLSQSGKWLKAQVSFAVDVLNNICLDAEIGPYKKGETTQALSHLYKLGKNNLYIFDRGYFYKPFLREVYLTGSQFCFRLKRNACKEVSEFINSKQEDTIAFIDVGQTKIKVRLTRILLDGGEEEYLATSLFDTKLFTASRLKTLYHLRWVVEEQYKDMKYAICVENFTGKKPNSIKQEFYAKILAYNLSMMACKPLIDKVSNQKKKKYKYKTNKRALLAKIKQCFVKLFFELHSVQSTLNNIVKFISKESVPIREGRKYQRGDTFKAKRKMTRPYVPVI